MKSIIAITPTTNVENNRVVVPEKVQTRTYNSNMDVFTFYNTRDNKTWRGNLMNVSLYDDLIVEDGVQYHILSMLTK